MAKIKEIWCMHHSHLDIGYTHPQPMLMELQGDYIEQAIDLCEKTEDWPEESRFKWTCEAFYPVVKWMRYAETAKIEKFKRLIAKGSISMTALPLHTTPCATEMQLNTMMRELDVLREELDTRISTAINHDINGQPWTMAQILLDSHVDFYMTGINIHFGGIPFKRPMAFRWKTPDGRMLLSYVGEHYSLFSQFFHTYEADTAVMHREIDRYAKRLETQGHDWDFAFLTATNPPLMDNNCPDAGLADLIRRYNEEGHEYTVRFATPEMLRDKLRSMGDKSFPEYGGDWTDYWNFGCASAARETRANKLALRTMESAGVFECMTGAQTGRYLSVRKKAEQSALIYHEHTWGASQSVTDPEDYESQSQRIHKLAYAYKAADLSGYLVASQIERFLENPAQTDEMNGIAVFNPTSVTQKVRMHIPEIWFRRERQLSARRAKEYIPYLDTSEAKMYFDHWARRDCGAVELPPFGYQIIPFSKLPEYACDEGEKDKFRMEDGVLETPYYRVALNSVTGRVKQIYDRRRDRELLNEKADWSFFELVRETIDARYHEEHRKTLYPRDVDLCNENISLWNHEWKAKRTGADRIVRWDLKTEGNRAILSWETEMLGMEKVEQRLVFYSDSPYIDLRVRMKKLPVCEPEGIYLAFPVKIGGNWKACYSSAGQMVLLDEEQLGHVCRDYLSVDNGVAVYNEDICFGLACPHAPMVQVGDFHFGKESRAIPRKENPLLLAWPLNNYWDTNFVANQSGTMEFSYRFFVNDRFSRTDVYGEFVRGENRGLTAPVSCKKEGAGAAVAASEEGVITSIYPAKKEGMLVLLHNREMTGKTLSIGVPDRRIKGAWLTDTQEKKTDALCGEAETVKVSLAPGAMARVLIMYT